MRRLASRQTRPFASRRSAVRPATAARLGAALATALALGALGLPGPAGAADAPAGSGLFGDLLPLSAIDLASLASGGPLILSGVDTAGGGVASNSVAIAPDGTVTIHSSASASANIAGAPVTVTGGGQLITGGFDGGTEMANSGGIATLQASTGLNDIQQGAVSFAFVVTGLPQ